VSTVVAATGKFRVMAVTPDATGLLENIEITGGRAGPNSYGGGIYSQGVLTLSHDWLTGNTAGAGGGVGNAGGTLTVTSSTIENNNGAEFGGRPVRPARRPTSGASPGPGGRPAISAPSNCIIRR
jgi:hypothetical protein